MNTFTIFGSCLSHDFASKLQDVLNEEIIKKYAFRIPFAYLNNEIIPFGEEQNNNFNLISDCNDKNNYKKYFESLNLIDLLKCDYVLVDLVKETYNLQKINNNIAIFSHEYDKYSLINTSNIIHSGSDLHQRYFEGGVNRFLDIFGKKKIIFINFSGGTHEDLQNSSPELSYQLKILNDKFRKMCRNIHIIDMEMHKDMVDVNHKYGPSILHMSDKFWSIAVQKFLKYDL